MEYEEIRGADASGSNHQEPMPVLLYDGTLDDKYFIRNYESEEGIGQVESRSAITTIFHFTIYEAHGGDEGSIELTISGEADVTVVSTAENMEYMFLPSSTEFKTILIR